MSLRIWLIFWLAVPIPVFLIIAAIFIAGDVVAIIFSHFNVILMVCADYIFCVLFLFFMGRDQSIQRVLTISWLMPCFLAL